MDVMIGAYGSSYSEEGAAHIVYGTNTSLAYEASFLDLGAEGGGLDGIDGFTLTGIMMEFPIYAELVRYPVLIVRWTSARFLPDWVWRLATEIHVLSQLQGISKIRPEQLL